MNAKESKRLMAKVHLKLFGVFQPEMLISISLHNILILHNKISKFHKIKLKIILTVMGKINTMIRYKNIYYEKKQIKGKVWNMRQFYSIKMKRLKI